MLRARIKFQVVDCAGQCFPNLTAYQNHLRVCACFCSYFADLRWALEYICIYIYIYSFIVYFWLYWVFVTACRPSLVAISRGYPLVAVLGLFIAVASLVAEHRL